MQTFFKSYSIASIVYFLLITPTTAQLIPDRTLGTNNSIVKSNNNFSKIDGGAVRGNNLFHSFQEFNVNFNQEVLFNNQTNIQSIFTRVTGGNISQIDGVIGNVGQADLFIINPAGIIFGANAQLNIGGSFFATTAESILFDNNFEFSAINPKNPPLLTVNMPIGLQFGKNPRDIINRANLVKEERFGEKKIPIIFPLKNENISVEEKIVNTLVGLEVNRDNNITLVGGNIILDGGGLSALGGKIQLGGLATEGIITIETNGNLVFPNNIPLSNIKLINDSSIDVRGNGNGDILITGQNIEIKDGSTLFAGIRPFEGSKDAKAGDIIINGIDRVVLDGIREANSKRGGKNFATTISNQIGNPLEKQNNPESNIKFEYIINGKGQGGNIEINTKKLDITNGATIISLTSGRGNSGDILINATEEINLKTDNEFTRAANLNNIFSTIDNTIFATGDVNSGKIKINTPSLNLLNLSRIRTRIFRGEGGANTGDIIINTESLKLIENARITQLINNRNLKESDTANLGNIIINADRQVSIIGKNKEAQDSRIINVFNKGNAEIFDGIGNPGQIIINTQSLELSNGSKISNRIAGKGKSGNIIINAKDRVILDSEEGSRSAIINTINKTGNGDSGDIIIETKELILTNGSLINQNIAREGKGSLGKIEINAETIEIDGEISKPQQKFPNFFLASSIFNTVNAEGTGNGGLIIINTENLFLTNKGQLFTSTVGNGNAGELKIQAKIINISGGNIESKATVLRDIDGNIVRDSNSDIIKANGNGGTIDIETSFLNLSNQGIITVSSNANGNPGKILIKTHSLELDRQSKILAETNFLGSESENHGDNFDINIDIKDNLILKNNSLISAKATEKAHGGNVQINSDFIVAFPKNNDIIATAEKGNGGTLNINTNAILGLEFRNKATPLNDITASSEFGLDGNVAIQVLDINLGQSLTELPTSVIDASRLIATNCLAGDEENKFVVTGKGGLPANPNDNLRGNAVLSAEWVGLEANQEDNQFNVDRNKSTKAENYPLTNSAEANDTKPLDTSTTQKIVEARSWTIGENGNVILTAAPIPQDTIKIPWFIPHDCYR